jgi:hypothetical protein
MKYICIDFDGTIVEHKYPAIGEPVPMAIETMKELHEKGSKLILFTMRSGKPLDEAVDYLKENGIELYGVNKNPTQWSWTKSPKAYGNIYIDDAALGCPLIHPEEGRPYVDWNKVRELLCLEDT